MNQIIQFSKLNEKALPDTEEICINCQWAIWYSSSYDMTCHCAKMLKIVWNSNKRAGIRQCGAFQVVASDISVPDETGGNSAEAQPIL